MTKKQICHVEKYHMTRTFTGSAAPRRKKTFDHWHDIEAPHDTTMVSKMKYMNDCVDWMAAKMHNAYRMPEPNLTPFPTRLVSSHAKSLVCLQQKQYVDLPTHPQVSVACCFCHQELRLFRSETYKIFKNIYSHHPWTPVCSLCLQTEK